MARHPSRADLVVDSTAVDATDFTPGERVGGFLLLDPLARGGMGQVFAAREAETGRELVIKVPASLGPLMVESFEAEISTLAGLQHGSIVKIADYGVCRGRPWYAMERIHGTTLRHVLDAAKGRCSSHPRAAERTELPTQRIEGALPGGRTAASPSISALPPTLQRDELLRLCFELLDVLEYLHSQHIVHGDLKPENIFVLDSARPVLVDFGLASAFDNPRDSLSTVPRTVGTAAYMAPERILGRAFDARTDYYSLGCLMYECMAGANPFARSDVQGTMLAQLRFQPATLNSLDSTIAAPISRMVERLLEKSPLDRPGYASEIKAVMGRHGAPGAARGASLSRCAYLHRSPLLGRDGQLSTIQAHLRNLRTFRGSHLRLTGAAGSGKTRFLMKSVDLAEDDGINVIRVVGASGGLSASLPFEGIRGLLRALGDAPAASSPDVKHDLTMNSDEVAKRVLRDFLSLCTRTAMVLAIDHLADLDSGSQVFLRELAAADLRAHALLVIWADTPRGQPASWRPADIPINALTRAEVAAAIQAMLAVERSSTQLLESAYRVSEGNPYLLRCYLQLLIDDEALVRTPLQGWHLAAKRLSSFCADQSLGSARSLFARAIERLAPTQRELAGLAAILGRTFRTSLLATVANTPELEVATALAALAQDHIIELASENRYRFTHSQLRVMLAGSIESDRASAVHRQVAQVLAAEAEREPGVARDVAAHLRESGQHLEAARYHRMAANEHEARGERADAIECLDQALLALDRATLGASGGLRIELLEQLGDIYLSVRKLGEAGEKYEQALTAPITSATCAARLHRKLAAAHDRNRGRALRHLDSAIGILEAEQVLSPDSRAEWIESHLAAMFIHYWSQETAEVLARGEVVRPHVFEVGTDAQKASYHFNLAAALMLHRRFVTGSQELSHISKATELYSGLGNISKVSMCRFLHALILYFAGDLDTAEQSFSELLAVAERNVTATLQLRALTYVTLIARLKGEHSRVRRLAGSALSLAQEHGMREYEGTALANLAWLALDDGDAHACVELAKQARTAWADSHARCVYQWVAYVPWMAAQLEVRSSDGWSVLADLASIVLHESQQLPPDSVRSALEELRDVTSGAPSAIRVAAHRVVSEARLVRWL